MILRCDNKMATRKRGHFVINTVVGEFRWIL